MNDEQITRLLQDLVRTASVDPHGHPGTTTQNTGESRIAEYVADVLRKLAIDVEVHEVEPGRPNVIGKFSSRGAQKVLAFAPHTDTVSVAGMTIDPFAAEIRDGKLYGRGASDTKGSLAAMLAGLANAVRRREFREGDLDVCFCALMGEESGNDGARALVQRGFKADFAVAGEPTNCRAVNTHKGAITFRIITRGKSVHSSEPERGESAIKKMAGVVDYLLGEYADSLRQIHDPVLGRATRNVGTIRGGSKVNIVPARCEIEVDHRTLPGEDHLKLLRELRVQFGRIETETLNDNAGLDTSASHPMVVQLAAASGGRCVGAPWFSDGAIFAQHGVPAVAFGAGSIAQAHTRDEFTSVPQVERCAAVVETFLANLS